MNEIRKALLHKKTMRRHNYITRINNWVDGELDVVERGFGTLEHALEYAAQNPEHTVKVYLASTNELIQEERSTTIVDSYA